MRSGRLRTNESEGTCGQLLLGSPHYWLVSRLNQPERASVQVLLRTCTRLQNLGAACEASNSSQLPKPDSTRRSLCWTCCLHRHQTSAPCFVSAQTCLASWGLCFWNKAS